MNNTVKRNRSVMHVFDIIEAMARYREPIKQSELSKMLDMAVPTVYRFLLTLMESGYVKQDEETLKYFLTMKICEIANIVHESMNIRAIAFPELKKLAEQCKESACLVIEEDLMAVYIEKVEGPDTMIRGFQRIGKRAPLYCTGVGKLFLSRMNESSFRNVIEKGLIAYTHKTITTEEKLMSELKKIKKQGYAIDDEECEIGARCLAAPIRDFSGKIVAAVSISGPTSRMTDMAMEDKKKYVLAAGNSISEILGFTAGKSGQA